MSHARLVLLSVCCLLCSQVALAAPSEQTVACVAASTEGQTDRDEGRLLAARAKLLSCADQACPSIVQKSCGEWLVELDHRIPSVVIRVDEPGQSDVTDAEVRIDDGEVALDGRPVLLDPGTHTLAVRAEGWRDVERTFLVAEREQARLLVVRLERDKPVATAVPRVAAPTKKPLKRREPPRFRIPVTAWVLAGVGAAGVVSAGVLYQRANHERARLDELCDARCNPSVADHGKRLALGSTISLGVGIAALAGAGVWTASSFLWGERRPESRAQLSLWPTAGGVFGAWSTRY